MTTTLAHCNFCSKHKDEIGKLIVSQQVAICNECVDLCQSLLQNTKLSKTSTVLEHAVADPKKICDYLDKYVVGQRGAKIVLAVAIVNHYKRISRPSNDIVKSNILMIGSTGTGKTLLARTVAQYLDVPFVIADATCLTEAGYVGDDVESMISRLYAAANGNVLACERGIVFLDEVDKIARKGESATVSRDVSGEGVQQALLKLIEGTKCRIIPAGSKKILGADTVEIDTTNILFIAGGAFVGLERIVTNRQQGTAMGFCAQLGLVGTTTPDIMPDDLVRYGMIPEFIARFSNYVSLSDLTKSELISILTEVRGSFVRQYQWLFGEDGVTLEFDADSLDLIADRTLANRTGARGLQSELERVLLPHMFDLIRYREQSILQVMIDVSQVQTPTALTQTNL